MWVLYLNQMQSNPDHSEAVAWAEDRATLERFVATEKAPEPYQEGPWTRYFKPDSILKWFYGPEATFDGQPYKDAGTLDQALQRTREQWEAFRTTTLKVE